MKALTPNEYYTALAFYIIASQAQHEARKFDEKLEKLVGDAALGDAIYNPENCGTKEEFDAVIQKRGIEVDWLAEEKKQKKKEGVKNEQPN